MGRVEVTALGLLLCACSTSDPVPDAGEVPSEEVWEGYIEMFAFPSGSDRLEIRFDLPDRRTGQVQFGMGMLPPATDPDVGYPSTLVGDDPPIRDVQEGFAYPIETASTSVDRVVLSVEVGRLWAGWCALQAADDPCFQGLAAVANPDECHFLDPATGDPIPVDCTKFWMCLGHVCTCDATECTDASVHQVSIDFHIDGDAGTGSISLVSGNHNIHLDRQ